VRIGIDIFLALRISVTTSVYTQNGSRSGFIWISAVYADAPWLNGPSDFLLKKTLVTILWSHLCFNF